MGFIPRYRPMPCPGVVGVYFCRKAVPSQLRIARGRQNTWPSSMRLWANLCTTLLLRSWPCTLESFSVSVEFAGDENINHICNETPSFSYCAQLLEFGRRVNATFAS
eukprot:1990821-Amphidinium_carterae.1